MDWSLLAYEVLVRNDRTDGKTRKTTSAITGQPSEEEAVDRTICRPRFRNACGNVASLSADSHSQSQVCSLRHSNSVHDVLSRAFETRCNVPVLIISLASSLLPAGSPLSPTYPTTHPTHSPLIDHPGNISSGQSFWLQIQGSRVRFPALPDLLSSSGSGTGSTQPREVN
jgi:hypothetical protein